MVIQDLHRIWLPSDGANIAPLENEFGVQFDFVAFYLSNPPLQLARAPGALRGFCRFGLGFALSMICHQLLRQWNESAHQNNIGVANTLGQHRCVFWKSAFEHHQAMATPAVGWNHPVAGMMLEALRFVLVPGNGLEHEQCEHKQ